MNVTTTQAVDIEAFMTQFVNEEFVRLKRRIDSWEPAPMPEDFK